MYTNSIQKLTQIHHWQLRGLYVLFSAAMLLLVFLNQKFDYLASISGVLGLEYSTFSKHFIFSFNKTVRFLLNDLLTILMIYGLFYKRKYVIIAFIVQLFGLVILLPTYLTIKSYYPAYNGPLISWLHRFTLNPLLLMLLIPAFFYQKQVLEKRKESKI